MLSPELSARSPKKMYRPHGGRDVSNYLKKQMVDPQLESSCKIAGLKIEQFIKHQFNENTAKPKKRFLLKPPRKQSE